MSANNKTIIQNISRVFLNSYIEQFAFIDKQILKELKNVAELQIKPSNALLILKAFNIYCYLYDVNLNYLTFKNSSNKELFTNFLNFCLSDFFNYSFKFKQQIRNYLIRMFSLLNQDRVIHLDIDMAKLDFNFKLETKDLQEKLIIVQGYIFNKSKVTSVYLLEYAICYGDKAALKLFSSIDKIPNHYKISVGTITVFNRYISFCIHNKISLFNTKNEDLSKYASFFFNELNDRKINIEKHKQSWNDFVEYFNDVIIPISKDFLRIKTQRIKGNYTNIKTKNNKKFKDKLITEIPLEVSDEKSIFILKDKINQDIEIITNWSKNVIDDYLIQQTIGEYPSEDFFIEDIEILKTKYKMWREGGINKWIDNNFNTKAILNKKHLFAICCLLVINHPSITEQFLKELTFNSLVKTDNGIFLIGNKHRKGKELSEQKVLLNEFTVKLINILIENYNQMSKIMNSDSLLLHVHEKAKFKIIKANDIDKTNYTENSLKEYIKTNYNFDEVSINEFISKVIFTKIRATCAIKEFFNNQNTKKMAEILGHENYSPSLLSHYLPEPIIHFYQSRWIRIFQKGIIYESMKDSEFLLNAIGFKTMDALNEFLSNHMLKNLPGKDINEDKKTINTFDECFVSINEENLIALLSLREAVKDSSRKFEIKEKAMFWSDFTDKLEDEIKNNKTYYSYNKLLEKAKVRINLNNFTEVIYA